MYELSRTYNGMVEVRVCVAFRSIRPAFDHKSIDIVNGIRIFSGLAVLCDRQSNPENDAQELSADAALDSARAAAPVRTDSNHAARECS